MRNTDFGPDAVGPILRLPSEILVVEDNFLIALDTRDMLLEIGVESVRCADSVARALELIENLVPQFCLLDVNLGPEKCFDVAQRLWELKVPFAFATGYGETDTFPAHLADTQIVSKPYTKEALRRVILIPGTP